MILGQKLTLNHPSLVDEGEKTRVLVTAHKRKGEREKKLIQTYFVIYFSLQKIHSYSKLSKNIFSIKKT